MIPCLNQDTLRTTTTEDFLRIARQAEYEAIELTIDKTEPFIKKNQIRGLKNAVDDLGLKVASINGPENFNLLNKEDFSTILERTRRLASAAREIGCDLLVPVPSPLKDELAGEAVVNLTAIALEKLAEECGMETRLGLEFLGMRTCSVHDLRSAVDIVRHVSKPNVGLTLDSFHMHLSQSSLSTIKNLEPSKIFLVHVNDSEPGDIGNLDDTKRLFPGEGVIDLRRFKVELESLGYNGFVSLELLRPSYWHQDPIQIARRGRESLRMIFGI